ncbi:LamG domain-containing protein [Hymenobacter terricola]|uniref:LamG domain-containing protein n=1 Tax=Hymenobacter terricola TaxID=2819236 RepID=UPI001B3170B6|nr:LamG domain-containing protein [Hymenobacter terricola]
MKNAKVYLFILALLMFGAASVISSCSKSNDSTPAPTADKAKLSALIDSVNTVYTAAVEGTKPGTYAAGSKAILKTSIDLATTTKNDGAATQATVNTSESSLRRAAKTFQNSLIQEVSAANLVAQWKFAGNANDATANANNGVLKTGPAGAAPTFPAAPADGTVLPIAVADRFGRANQAYEFNGGAYIEVPYRLALNPQAITISAWVKPFDSNPDNYIVSLNRWTGYKFQLQGDRKPFLTVTTTNTTNPISDRDAASGIVAVNVWSHVVSSYVDGTMKFYINGALVKTWTDVTGTIRAVGQQVPLCIGQQLPKNIYNSAPTAGQAADYFQYYSPAYFKGQMDDIRIYNRALSDAEVQSIFTIENTL